jgi:hypothetical protein
MKRNVGNDTNEKIRMKRHSGTKQNSGFSCQYSGKFKKNFDSYKSVQTNSFIRIVLFFGIDETIK